MSLKHRFKDIILQFTSLGVIKNMGYFAEIPHILNNTTIGVIELTFYIYRVNIKSEFNYIIGLCLLLFICLCTNK